MSSAQASIDDLESFDLTSIGIAREAYKNYFRDLLDTILVHDAPDQLLTKDLLDRLYNITLKK